jgi:hypothetical protein
VKFPVEGCGEGNEGGEAAGVGNRWDGMSAAVGRRFVRGRGERGRMPLAACVAADSVSGLASPEFTLALLALQLARILDLFLS